MRGAHLAVLGRVAAALIACGLAVAACGADPREVGGPLVIDRPADPGPLDETAGFAAANRACPPEAATDPILETAGPQPIDLELALDLPGAAAIAFAPDGSAFVGTRDGAIHHWDGTEVSSPVLDLRSDTRVENDAGLLGLAVHYGRLYVYRSDLEGDTVLSSYPLENGVPRPAAGTELLRAHQPTSQHNGGSIAFDPSGNLYLALGDGGGPGNAFGTAQDPESPFGALLRMRAAPGRGTPVQAAPGNPYVGSAPGHELVWARGLRNPFRFSVDPVTGDLWLGDVGQQCAEEINVVPTTGPGGLNLGWSAYEGRAPFQGELADGAHHHEPFFSYPHTFGRCAVIAGEVYRGGALPGFDGRFVFADHCSGELITLDPATGLAWVVHRTRGMTPVALAGDGSGAMYLLDLGTGVWRLVPNRP